MREGCRGARNKEAVVWNVTREGRREGRREREGEREGGTTLSESTTIKSPTLCSIAFESEQTKEGRKEGREGGVEEGREEGRKLTYLCRDDSGRKPRPRSDYPPPCPVGWIGEKEQRSVSLLSPPRAKAPPSVLPSFPPFLPPSLPSSLPPSYAQKYPKWTLPVHPLPTLPQSGRHSWPCPMRSLPGTWFPRC